MEWGSDFNQSQLNELKAVLLDFLPKLTCYKCKSIPRADDPYLIGYKCSNPNVPHLLCNKCSGKCPCNSNVSKEACPIILRVVKMFPFCCKNRKAGCEEILFERKMKSHHAECIFEEVRCISTECREKMPFKEVLGHLGSDECKATKPMLKLEKGAKLSLMLDYTDDGLYWAPQEIKDNPLDEPLFYSVGMMQNGISHIWIYFVGMKMQADRFSYSLEIGDKTNHFISFVGPVKSIFESYEDILKAGDVFMFSVSGLQKLSNKDKRFECVLNIIEKKAETQDSDDDSEVSEGQ